jgi:hypothetical protein
MVRRKLEVETEGGGCNVEVRNWKARKLEVEAEVVG